MRPVGQAVIWGLVNAVAYAISAATVYPSSIAPHPSDRWVFGAVAFGSVLAASMLAGWSVIRTRKSEPSRAWRLGGIASCVAAGLVHLPVLFWITITAYEWYERDHGPGDGKYLTYLGMALGLPFSAATIFLVVYAVAKGLSMLNRG